MSKVEGYDIEEKVNGKIFTDFIKDSDSDNDVVGSKYILYIKFVDFPHLINKCGLVIIYTNSYVVNNDYRFHHLEIKDYNEYYDEYNFITINEKNPNKKQITTYYKVK